MKTQDVIDLLSLVAAEPEAVPGIQQLLTEAWQEGHDAGWREGWKAAEEARQKMQPKMADPDEDSADNGAGAVRKVRAKSVQGTKGKPVEID